MKVALVLCPQWHAAFPTYALAALSAQLKAAGHEPVIVDLNRAIAGLDEASAALGAARGSWVDEDGLDEQFARHHAYLESEIERVLAQGCRVLGFQLYFTNAKASLRLARLFKKRDPAVVTVFGGSECLTFDNARRYARQDGVDAVVYGEGDVAFPKLVDALARAGKVLPGPGVLVRGEEPTWKDEQEWVEDLDALPYADYSGHRLALYPGGKSLHTCRGCVRRCVFCSEWRDKKYRQMSGRRVYDELAEQLRRDPKISSFLFADSLMNGSMRGLDALCDLILAGGMKIEWRGYAIVRPEMTPAFLEKMARAGCRELFFGLESGSPRILERVGKNVAPALNARVLADCARAGIRTAAGFLVGFPSETEDDFRASLDFLKENARAIGRLDPNPFMIAELMGQWDEYGLEPTDEPTFWRTRDGANTFPLRMERFGRLLRAARDSGVEVYWEGLAPAQFDAKIASMLENYRRWETSGR